LVAALGGLLFGFDTAVISGTTGWLESVFELSKAQLGFTVAWAFISYGDHFNEAGSMIVLGSVFLFIASHAFGQGSVIWVYLSEIFPNRVRGRGQSLGTITHWIAAAIISWTFPLIAEFSGGYVFAVYAIFMVIQLFWVITRMVETKGVSLEQIQKKLGID
jgi:hypothetical protein